MSEEADSEAPDHKHFVRRKKTTQDWVTTIGGLVAIVGSLAAGVSWAMDELPFVKNKTFSEHVAAEDGWKFKMEEQVGELNNGVVAIKRNGLLTLQLQYQSRVDTLTEAMKKLQPDSPTYQALADTKAEAAQQLQELNRQLRR